MSESDDQTLDDLEQEVMNEHQFGEANDAHRFDANADVDDLEIEIDPVVKEFGAENDEGIIQTVKSGVNLFFFVETAGPINNEEESHFSKLGHLWQGVKMTPSRFDDDGNELETDPNDSIVVYAELYIPKQMASEDGQVLSEFLEEGAWALQKLYFPENRNVSDKVPISQAPPVMPVAQVPAAQAPPDVPVAQAPLDESLLKLVQKSDKEKNEEKVKKESELAELVFKDTDEFVPEKEKVTLTLSEPIIPAVLGLLKKNRRLTPTTWKELKAKKYKLSPEQTKLLSPLSNMTGSDEEESLFDSLAPPLAKALSSLLKKNVDFHLPTFKMFDILWRSKSTNKSQYATPLKSLPEAQAVIDNLLEHMQHQIMTQALLNYQLKLQVGNVMAGLAKDSVVSKVMQHRIQDNLDNNPSRGVMGNMTKTVTELDKTRKSLAKGFPSLLGKRPAADVSLTAEKQPRSMKLYSLSSKNRYQSGGYQRGANRGSAGGSGNKGYRGKGVQFLGGSGHNGGGHGGQNYGGGGQGGRGRNNGGRGHRGGGRGGSGGGRGSGRGGHSGGARGRY